MKLACFNNRRTLNRKEYNRTVEEYSVRLYRFLYRSLQNEQNAKDLVQDTFLRLWENREKIIHGKVKSWLFTVAYNLMINFIKKHSRQDYVAEFFYEKGADGNTSFEQQDVLTKCLNELTDQQRSIILLRDLEGYNYKEIGEILTLNESQVKVYLFRARKRMKDMIKDLSNAI